MKTILGGILHAAWFAYYIFIGEVTPELQLRGHMVIGVLTTVGIGHKVIKRKKKQDE